MNKYQQKHIIRLSARQERELKAIVSSGSHKAREIKRAQVLLKSHQGMKDQDIALHVGTTVRSVERIRLRYAKGNLKQAVFDAPRSGQPPTVTDTAEARLVAIACSSPPDGAAVWTLELLRQRLLRDKVVKHISTVAIWHHLKERGIKPWREKNVVHSQSHG